MNPQELRLGNLINLRSFIMDEIYREIKPEKNPNLYLTPIRVTVQILSAIEKGSKEYSPINLTPSLLEACGFDHVYEACGWCDKHHIVYALKDGVWELHPFCTNDTDVRIKLKYLHQLQNLEFALTGTELEVNLEKVKA